MNIDCQGLLSFTPADFVGQSVAILGIKGSGKSNTAAVLMEELLLAHIPIQVVDIAGEYFTLKDKFPRLNVIGRSWNTTTELALTARNAENIADKVYVNGLSVIIDVIGIPSEARSEILLVYFTRIWSLAGTHRIPNMIFLEEAHNWMPQRSRTAVSSLLVDFAAEGRKRGISLVMIGQRSARIDKDTLSASAAQGTQERPQHSQISLKRRCLYWI